MLKARDQRPAHPDRAGNADGRDVPAVLDPGPSRRGAAGERLPAGPGQAAVGAADRIPRHRGPVRPDRRVLRAPRRLALVRPQRGVRAALRLPRLEVRRDRPVRRDPVRARRAAQQPLREDQAHSPTRWSRSATSCGPTWATRRSTPDAARSGSSSACPPGRRFTSKRWQECNWLQALEGGIDSSHVSWLHSGGLNARPAVQGGRGQQVQPGRPQALLRGRRESDGGLFIGARRNAEDGHYYWRITPVGHAQLHDDPAARRPPDPRPLLDPDRRRELLGLFTFDYHPVRAADRRRAAGDARRERACTTSTSPAPSARCRTRTTTT